MPGMECSAVLFDLDGVLVDSTACVTRVWRQWAVEQGLDPDYVVHVAHGRRTIETVQVVAPHLDAETEMRNIEGPEIENTDGLRRFPGALELVTAIPAERWGIVTSGTRALATARLQAGQVPMPRVLVPADEVSRGKPHPEPYLTGASRLGFPPEECLVIEDAPSGIRAAHAAGMRVIGVPTTYPVEELAEADVLLRALADLRLEVLRDGDAVARLRLHYASALRG